jgi:uncharacterized protein (DUF433 family)
MTGGELWPLSSRSRIANVPVDFFLGNVTFFVYNWVMSERIIMDPDVCNGKPIVKGTRIAVQTILEFLAAGDSIEEVLEEYPRLNREDIQACFEFASRLMGNRFSIQPVT